MDLIPNNLMLRRTPLIELPSRIFQLPRIHRYLSRRLAFRLVFPQLEEIPLLFFVLGDEISEDCEE